MIMLTLEAGDISSIEEFHSAVDDYLEFAKVGKDPEKEYKEHLMSGFHQKLHKKLALCAFKDGLLFKCGGKSGICLVDSEQSQTRAFGRKR